MIPIQLTIQGLYSYQEKQTIDFTRLTAGKLFGIFGTVGSGKSTILEAITFALYGRTDRLNLSGDNRYYNMMNLKSNELLIDFIFETGIVQTAYRATVKGRRNSKNFEDVKTLERSAYIKTDDKWLPIENEALEQAIGLSYENFKRTIIIPQGQFQEFLQLGNKDRTQMMKELFNLGKFEFYNKVTSLESKNNARKQNIEGQLQQLGTIDPAQVIVYQEQLTKLEEEIKEQNRKLTENHKAEEQLRRLQELTQKKADADKEQKILQEQEPKFQELQEKIIRYEQCMVSFKHLLDSLKEKNKRQEERKKQISDDNAKLKAEEVEIEMLDILLKSLKTAYEKREELKKKAEELTRILKTKALEKTINQEESRLNKGTTIWDETNQQIEKLKSEKQQVEILIKEKRASIPDLMLLSTIKAWFTEKHNLDKQLIETGKEISKYIQQEKGIKGEVSQILTAPVFKNLPQDAAYDACVRYLEAAGEKIKDKQKTLNDQESYLRVKTQLKAYAEELEEGRPCPLCGSLHHPEVFVSEDINEEQDKLVTEKKILEKEMEQITSSLHKISLLDNQKKLILENQKELAEKKKEQQQKTAAHTGLFVWKEYQNEDDLNKAFAKAKQIQEELKEHEKTLESISKQLKLEEKNKEQYQIELEKIRTSLTVHQTEKKTLAEQLQLVKPEEYNQTPDELIEKERSELLNEHNRIEKEFIEQSTLLQQHNKQKDILEGSLKTNRRELEQDQATIESLKKLVDEELAKSSFQSFEEVAQILSEPFDTEMEKQKTAQFKERLFRNRSLLEQLRTEIGDYVYDAEAHNSLISEISLLKGQISQKDQEKGKTAELLKKIQKDLISRKLLKKELEQLEIRAENIKTMKTLFKASGFVNYISSVYLQNLCNAANDRFFQLTRQKLSLEITPDNNFQVRDFMNGGKTRSVKTLSGGQTFQAALSLALALADNIQKITESNQNFFFLDEGFGSLDKEALNIVFDTLKSLRKENRIVGVISHVEEMQQEIEVHLRIENQAERGSIIQPGWLT